VDAFELRAELVARVGLLAHEAGESCNDRPPRTDAGGQRAVARQRRPVVKAHHVQRLHHRVRDEHDAEPPGCGGDGDVQRERDGDDDRQRDGGETAQEQAQGDGLEGMAGFQRGRKRYPPPRTVSTSRWWPPGDSARRSRRMWTSTVRSSIYT